jgi:hypothetical protein
MLPLSSLRLPYALLGSPEQKACQSEQHRGQLVVLQVAATGPLVGRERMLPTADVATWTEEEVH